MAEVMAAVAAVVSMAAADFTVVAVVSAAERWAVSTAVVVASTAAGFVRVAFTEVAFTAEVLAPAAFTPFVPPQEPARGSAAVQLRAIPNSVPPLVPRTSHPA